MVHRPSKGRDDTHRFRLHHGCGMRSSNRSGRGVPHELGVYSTMSPVHRSPAGANLSVPFEKGSRTGSGLRQTQRVSRAKIITDVGNHENRPEHRWPNPHSCWLRVVPARCQRHSRQFYDRADSMGRLRWDCRGGGGCCVDCYCEETDVEGLKDAKGSSSSLLWPRSPINSSLLRPRRQTTTKQLRQSRLPPQARLKDATGRASPRESIVQPGTLVVTQTKLGVFVSHSS